jgi:transposase
MEVVYYDVCGPMQVDSIRGNKYFVSFVGDFSITLRNFLIHKKNDMLEVFITFKLMVERLSGHKIKTLRTYGGGVYVSQEFAKYCDSEGIANDIVSQEG